MRHPTPRRKNAPSGARQIPRIRDSQPLGHSLSSEAEPDIFIRGAQNYRAKANPENPLGTKQSIEYVLRSLDRQAEDEKKEIKRQEKALARPAL